MNRLASVRESSQSRAHMKHVLRICCAWLAIGHGSSVAGQGVANRQISVAEVPDSSLSRRIPIAFVVLSATGRATRPPLFVMQGGPGIPGTALLNRYVKDSALRRSRDIVLFDQRG